MPRQFFIFITYDDKCETLAKMLHDMLSNDGAIVSSGHGVNIRLFEVADPLQEGASNANANNLPHSHRDIVYRQIQEHFDVPQENMFVISLLKGINHEEYTRVGELCSRTSPPIAHQVVSHIGNFNDVGLLTRNLTRRVSAFIVPQAAV